MGLYLNYELRLPGRLPAVDISKTIEALHRFALTLPFSSVSPVYRAPFAEAELAAQSARTFRLIASVLAEPWEDEASPHVGNVDSSIGFIVSPGRGCESATFGFMFRTDALGDATEWCWHYSCKTQYASVISDSHLIACHLSLILLLDEAIRLGIDVVVRDETHYWESRDEARLIAEVRSMNQIVAAIAGKVSDAIGPSAGSPLFAHREFERLEMGD